MSVKFNFKSLETGFEADWPVTVSVPKDGGVTEEQTFMARFRTPTPAEQAELDALQPADRLKRALEIGFTGLAESEGETLTPELRAALLGQSNVYLGLVRAYGSFRSGEAARKN